MTKLLRIIFIATLLSNCTGFAFYQGSFNFLKDNLIPTELTLITSEYFQDQKYSFAIVAIGNSPEFTMVLESIDNEEYKWVSSSGVVFITDSHGRIIRTRGLPNDVSYSLLSKPSMNNNDREYIIDFYNPKLYKVKGIDIIETRPNLKSYGYLVNKSIEVTEINFTTVIPILKWSEDSTILKDDRYAVSLSQKIHPHFPRIRMKFYLKFDRK
tara:strand:- start:249 stop:884 length:636 start_codon:yes stop_codon:yes gene_type:complete